MRYAMLFCLGLLIATNATAQMYRWVDDKGKVHYGDTIPPEYANRGNAQMDKSGRVIKKTDAALTAEQIAAREEAEAKAQQDKLKAEEQKRRDKALLATYTNMNEIALNEQRNLDQVDVRIKSNELRMKSVQERLDKQKAQAANFAKRQKPVPPDLTNEIKRSEDELAKLRGNIAELDQEKVDIRERFKVDRARFRELKGYPPEAPSADAPSIATPSAPTAPVVPKPAPPQAPTAPVRK